MRRSFNAIAPMLVSGLVLAAIASVAPAAPPEPSPAAAEQLRTSSRAPYIHRLTLYDHEGAAIDPKVQPAPPWSPYTTCGKCHPVGTIRGGWHFNSDRADVPPGRPGEPWILTDRQSGTQLPLSARRWPGTWTPADVGLTNWEFVRLFGHHQPGGGLGDPPPASRAGADALRWGISGQLQVDCLFCHSSAVQHDPAEAARQVERENFKWAPTAALGLAAIRGEARKLPDDWDPLAPPNPDYPDLIAPQVVFDGTRFDADNRVLFDVPRKPPVERCYFCHTVRPVGEDEDAGAAADGDVHLAAGLLCADCHRNGIDHRIVRGYPGESEDQAGPAATLTCRGCHLGTADPDDPTAALGGRFGAPHPQHRGLPPVHFEKLACTACHSGPWPQRFPRRVQTSLAHGLGLPSKERRDDDWPIIVEPIFAAQPDGSLAPHRLLWPAFWGRWQEGQLTPLSLSVVRPALEAVLPKTEGQPGAGPPLTGEQVAAILTELARSGGRSAGEPVRVADGRVYRRTTAGPLETLTHQAAGPYLWPLAHDVRPAGQALGVRGCTDCHADDTPFHFGSVFAEGDEPADPPIKQMYQLQGLDPRLTRTWAVSFAFRPAFKWGGFAAAGVLGAVLTLYGSAALARILRRYR